MIDQGDIPRPTEPTLTPDQIERCDKDLATMSSLTQLAISQGGVFELTGGYAAEAYLGGNITRPHGDIDGVLWIDTTQEKSTKDDVVALLNTESTEWELIPTSREHFIELREPLGAGERFKDKRRIELNLFDKSKADARIKKILIDSSGIPHEVQLAPLEQFIARKIGTLVARHRQGDEEKKSKGLRDTTQSDKDDLKKIIALSDFNKDNYTEAMIEHLRWVFGDRMTESKRRFEAEDDWQLALTLINS